LVFVATNANILVKYTRKILKPKIKTADHAETNYGINRVIGKR
jgi:hypothetical protein